MVGVSKTELNLTHFIQTLTFIVSLEISHQAEYETTLNFCKKIGEVMREKIIWPIYGYLTLCS